jgi:predicted transcriptional regulator
LNDKAVQLEERVKLLEEYIEKLRIEVEEEQERDQEEIKDIILEQIQNGNTTPTGIIEATGLPKNKVYEILKSLVEAGILEKKREGRHVHYILVHKIPMSGEEFKAVSEA